MGVVGGTQKRVGSQSLESEGFTRGGGGPWGLRGWKSSGGLKTRQALGCCLQAPPFSLCPLSVRA